MLSFPGTDPFDKPEQKPANIILSPDEKECFGKTINGGLRLARFDKYNSLPGGVETIIARV